MRGEDSVLYQVAVFGNLADILTANKVWIRFGPHVGRANPFCVDVVNAALGQVKIDIAIDSHMAFRQHFVCVRIVLRVIGVDVCVADVNGDIVSRCGQPILIAGFASGRDFDW